MGVPVRLSTVGPKSTKATKRAAREDVLPPPPDERDARADEEETGDRYGSENINKRTDIVSQRMKMIFTSLSKIEDRLDRLEQVQTSQGKANGSRMAQAARDRRRG